MKKIIPIKYVEWLLLSMIGDEEDFIYNEILIFLEELEKKLIINYEGKNKNEIIKNLIGKLELIKNENLEELDLKSFYNLLDNLENINFSSIEESIIKYLGSIQKVKNKILKKTISVFENISQRECEYTEEELNITSSKIGTFGKMDMEEIKDTIDYIRYHYSVGARDKIRLKILENALKLNKRISINRDDLLNIISEELKNNLDISKFKQNKKFGTTGNKTLDLPLSSLSLLKYYNEDNLEGFFDLFSKIISNVIEIQISSDFGYKKLNIFFLGNIINKIINSKEKQFVDTIINYNLSIELSILLVQTYILLKSYFPVVNYIFVIDKSLIMSDTETEYFNNENIPGDFSVGYFVKKILENYSDVNSVLNSNNEFYNFIMNGEKTTLIGANIKAGFSNSFNPNKELSINSICSKIFGQMDDYSIRQIDRVYIGSSFFHFYTVNETNFRYIPDIKQGLKLYIFSLDEKGNEEEMFFINLNDYIPIIEIGNLYKFSRKEVAHYDYIQNTTIQNTPKKHLLRLI